MFLGEMCDAGKAWAYWRKGTLRHCGGEDAARQAMGTLLALKSPRPLLFLTRTDTNGLLRANLPIQKNIRRLPPWIFSIWEICVARIKVKAVCFLKNSSEVSTPSYFRGFWEGFEEYAMHLQYEDGKHVRDYERWPIWPRWLYVASFFFSENMIPQKIKGLETWRLELKGDGWYLKRIIEQHVGEY